MLFRFLGAAFCVVAFSSQAIAQDGFDIFSCTFGEELEMLAFTRAPGGELHSALEPSTAVRIEEGIGTFAQGGSLYQFNFSDLSAVRVSSASIDEGICTEVTRDLLEIQHIFTGNAPREASFRVEQYDLRARLDMAESRIVILKKENAEKTLQEDRRVAAVARQHQGMRNQLENLRGLLDLAADKDLQSRVRINSLGTDLNSALARTAKEARKRAEVEAELRACLGGTQTSP
jgi:chemotaxis protein MotB